MINPIDSELENPSRKQRSKKKADKISNSHQDIQRTSVKGSAKHERKGTGKVFKEIIPPKNPALERLFSVAETTVFRSKTLDKKVPVEELFSNLSLTRGRNGVMKSKGRTNDGNEDVALPRTVQDAPRTGSLPPSQPTQQPTREEGNSQVMYIQRCQSESEALMHSCPPQLAEVNQTYLKQIEAFNLADQCNAGLPKLPKAQIKLSQVTEIPDRQKLLNVQDDQKNAAQNAKPEQNGQYYKIVDIDQNLQAGSKPETGEESEPRLSSPVKFSFDQSQYNNCLERKGRKDPAATAPRDEMLQALKRMKEKYNDALMEFASASPRNTEPHKASSGLPVGEEETEMAKKLPQAEARNAQTNEDTLKSELERLPVPRRNDAIHVFCVERENEKTKTFYRTFVATSYAAVWRAYLAAAAPTHLHWYEVIRENSACNLYFDLEYTLDDGLNAHVDGSGMVDILIRCVQRLMDRNWGVGFDPYSHVYELDSSTPSKFSRHLIIKLPGYAFYNNIAAGHFAAQVVEAAGNQIHVEKDEAKIPFVDIAVYTRNRHFRLPFSCKGGKTAVLRPTQRYACTPGAARPSPARIFLDSMICNVPVDAKLLLVQMPQQLENRSIGEMLSLSVNTNSFTLKNRAVTFTTKQPSSGRGKEWTAALRAVAEAALPFVEKIATQRAHQVAQARTIAFCGGDGTVAYSMIGPGSHYCENIGRPHKNNHVYFLFDFSALRYSQKCHDPECSSFRYVVAQQARILAAFYQGDRIEKANRTLMPFKSYKFRSAWMPMPEELCHLTERLMAPVTEAD